MTHTQKFCVSIFLSTLSLRRATLVQIIMSGYARISIHALLAESDPMAQICQVVSAISIHALLAESDCMTHTQKFCVSIFLSTLSLRRATLYIIGKLCPVLHFYPRSPCGERRWPWHGPRWCCNFYPRSPCGERRARVLVPAREGRQISIHALLAESDSQSGCGLTF